ncbi:MAG: 16S rRNA (guanine(527)-N(7))-methyltransferase RsmG [Mycoplasma sp.]
MNKQEFEIKIKELFPSVSDNFFSNIEVYKQYLNAENQKYNLTRLNTEELIYEKYFFASLIPFINTDLKNKEILDIGSGSGIPGIVLKILEPSIKLSIIESNAKKINFMTNLSNELKLSDISFFNIRSEDVEEHLIEKFDIVTSRAVSSLPILLEISSQYSKIDGLIIEPKSNSIDEEFETGIKHASKLSLSFLNKEMFEFNGCNYTTLFFKKDSATSNLFPRSWREIIKEFKNV